MMIYPVRLTDSSLEIFTLVIFLFVYGRRSRSLVFWTFPDPYWSGNNWLWTRRSVTKWVSKRPVWDLAAPAAG